MKLNTVIHTLLISLASIGLSAQAHDGPHGSQDNDDHTPGMNHMHDGNEMREMHEDMEKEMSEMREQTESHMQWAHGQVRRINKGLGKITLRHGPLKSVDMPPMTMVFTMRDPKALEALKVGDEVEFIVTKDEEDRFVVTDIRPKE